MNKDYIIKFLEGEEDNKTYTFNDIKVSNYDFSYPTLILSNVKDIKIKSFNEDDVIKKLTNKYTFLKLINERYYENILVAGGSISNIIIGRDDPEGDVDIFLYNITIKSAVKLIKELFEEILGIVKPSSSVYYRSSHTVSMIMKKDEKDIKVQVILRLYKEKLDILKSFDHGSSSVGYDGKNIILTELGKICYEI